MLDKLNIRSKLFAGIWNRFIFSGCDGFVFS